MTRTTTRLRAFMTFPILGAIASIVGIASGAKNLFGGGGSGGGGGGAPHAYVPTGLGQADQSWQNIMNLLQGNITGQQGATQPAMQQALAQMLGIDTSGLTRAGNAAGGMYGGLSGLSNLYSGMLGNQAGVNQQAQQNLMNAGNAAFTAGQDPQQALYNRTLQQVQEQSRGADSARGIAMSPQSAGLESQATSNFNIDWQNQQLQRMLQGLGGMTSAYGQAGAQGQGVGQNLINSLNMGAQAPQFMTQSGMTPFTMAQTAAQWPMNAANMYNQSMGGINQGLGNMLGYIIPYLNSGQGATNQAFGQWQTNMNQLTSGLSGLGNWWNNQQGPTPGGYGVTPGWDDQSINWQPVPQGGGGGGGNYATTPGT